MLFGGLQEVPQVVIPAKSHDLSFSLTNRGTRAGIQNIPPAALSPLTLILNLPENVPIDNIVL